MIRIDIDMKKMIFCALCAVMLLSSCGDKNSNNDKESKISDSSAASGTADMTEEKNAEDTAGDDAVKVKNNGSTDPMDSGDDTSSTKDKDGGITDISAVSDTSDEIKEDTEEKTADDDAVKAEKKESTDPKTVTINGEDITLPFTVGDLTGLEFTEHGSYRNYDGDIDYYHAFLCDKETGTLVAQISCYSPHDQADFDMTDNEITHINLYLDKMREAINKGNAIHFSYLGHGLGITKDDITESLGAPQQALENLALFKSGDTAVEIMYNNDQDDPDYGVVSEIVIY